MPLNTQKTAIVTSAARGIGLATSKLFLKEGWRVAMVDQDAEELSAATADLDSVIALNLDIASPKNAQAMRRYTLSAFGHIDALVNNAGVADFSPIEDTTYERWREVMATNLDGIFLCVQAAIPALKETQAQSLTSGAFRAFVHPRCGLPMAPRKRQLFISHSNRPPDWANLVCGLTASHRDRYGRN